MEPNRWNANTSKYFPHKLKGRYKLVFPNVTKETKINLLPLNINQDKQSLNILLFYLYESGIFYRSIFLFLLFWFRELAIVRIMVK